MSYHRGYGADAGPTPVPATEQPAPVEPTTQYVPSYNKQAFQLMGIAAVPWIPVLAGAYVGRRVSGTNGAWIGALSGFALSFFTIKHISRTAF